MYAAEPFKLKPRHTSLDKLELLNSDSIYCPDTDDDSVYDPDEHLTESSTECTDHEPKWLTSDSVQPDDTPEDDSCGFELEETKPRDSHYERFWRDADYEDDDKHEGTIYSDESYNDEPYEDIQL